MQGGAAYAAYTGTTSTTTVEHTKEIEGRCIVEISATPAQPASGASAGPTPSCTDGRVLSPADAYYVEYFGGDGKRLQIEDLKGIAQRCIKQVKPKVDDDCPPPAGHCVRVIRGVQYCVRC